MLQIILGPLVWIWIPVFLGFGVTMALAPSRADVLLAHTFFAIAFVLLLGKGIFWILSGSHPLPRPALAALVFSCVGFLWAMTYEWVDRKLRIEPLPVPAPVPTATQTEREKPTPAPTQTPSDKFSIRGEFLDAVDFPLFYRYRAGSVEGGPLRLAPVGLLLSMEVTPRTGVPSKIDYYHIDIEHKGHWVRLYNLRPDNLTNFFTPTGAGLKAATQLDFRDWSFDIAAFSRPIPVRGWVFLERPHQLRGVAIELRHLRATVRDTSGYEQISEIDLSERRWEEPGSNFYFGDGMRVIDPIGSKDLSGIAILPRMDDEAQIAKKRRQ